MRKFLPLAFFLAIFTFMSAYSANDEIRGIYILSKADTVSMVALQENGAETS